MTPTCPTCAGLGYVQRGTSIDACPRCTKLGEMAWRTKRVGRFVVLTNARVVAVEEERSPA